MARVTRSKKINISEDHTAVEVPTDIDQHHLVELSNNMAAEEKGIAAELKGLKAAYKQAIGLGMKVAKVGKNNKRGTQEVPVYSENSNNVINSGAAGKKDAPIGQESRQAKASDGSLVSRMDQLTLKDLTRDTERLKVPQQPTRMTRRQAAAERQERQEGQYKSESWSSEKIPVFFSQEERFPLRNSTNDCSVWSVSPSLSGSYPYMGPAFQNYRSMVSQVSLTSTSDDGSIVHHTLFPRPNWTNDNPSSLAEKALDNYLVQNSTTTPAESISVADVHSDLDQINEKQVNSNAERISILIEDTQTFPESHGSPNKSQIITLDEVEREYGDEQVDLGAQDSDDDSFVELITSRSPAKPVSRIEDSVEALDQLEEAIDSLNQAALTQNLLSPQKKASPDRSPSRTPVTDNKSKKANFSTMRVKPTAPRESIIRRVSSMTLKASPVQEAAKPVQPRESIKRPLSLQAPKATVKSSKPPTQANFELPGEAVARRLKEQREARRMQREQAEANKAASAATIRRTRSTKELTRPTFELPGEALSRKKREAQEARLKVQEEEERKRREFKAKPLRTSLQPSVIPRETVASLARKSKVGFEGVENSNLSLSKRNLNGVSSRPSIANVIQANTSAPRSPGTLRRKPSTIIAPSLAGLTTQRTVSATDVQAQRQRAREIYNRDQRETEDFEREKREREAAAKLAREAAAERGRQASREWAERQKAKRASAQETGPATGYGPGGQLGLRPF